MLFQHTIPREVDAYDFTTGGPYMAPPVPYGHYAADYVDEFHKSLGCVTCRLHGLMGGGAHGHSLFHKVTVPAAAADTVVPVVTGGAAAWPTGAVSGRPGHGLFGHGGHSSSGILDGGNASPVILGGSPGLGNGSAGYATTWAPASEQTGAVASGQPSAGNPAAPSARSTRICLKC